MKFDFLMIEPDTKKPDIAARLFYSKKIFPIQQQTCVQTAHKAF